MKGLGCVKHFVKVILTNQSVPKNFTYVYKRNETSTYGGSRWTWAVPVRVTQETTVVVEPDTEETRQTSVSRCLSSFKT